MSQKNNLGQVYRCPICGAETSVIAAGEGQLAPRCCNREMLLCHDLHTAYVCPVCGSEILVLKEISGTLEPYCCNELMQKKEAA